MSSDPMDQPVVLDRRVLRDGVHDRLLEGLLDGSLTPGSSLSIDGLARRLDVSPTPVREALAQLEHTGLVMRMPLRGYKVAPRLTTEEVAWLVDARGVIEHAAIDRALDNTGDQVQDVVAAYERQANVVARMVAREEGRDPGPRVTAMEYFEADWGFHQAIWRCAGHPYLQVLGDALTGHSYRVRQSYGRGLSDVQDAVEEHKAILDALVDGDRERAHREMSTHLGQIVEHSTADRLR